MSLTPAQLERYQRHILLKEIGGTGQQKLRSASVLVIGAGGLGASLLSYLAASGIGRIGIIDDDKIELSNLQRQILYQTKDIGARKTDIAAKRLKALNPDCDIITYPMRLDADNALALMHDYDIIADGCDNFATRFLVNDACFFAHKPLVSASVAQFSGQLACFKPYLRDKTGVPLPCYRSLVPDMPSSDEGLSCEQDGVLGAVAGVVGSMQAVEIIKEITKTGTSLAGSLLIYHALTAHSRLVKLNWEPDNPLNGTNPKFLDLSHHAKSIERAG